jgi:hypothetical protein
MIKIVLWSLTVYETVIEYVKFYVSWDFVHEFY